MSNDEKLIRERALNQEPSIKEEVEEPKQVVSTQPKNNKPFVKKGIREELTAELSRNYELEDGSFIDFIKLKTPLVADIFEAEELLLFDEDSMKSIRDRKNSKNNTDIESMMIIQSIYQKKLAIYVASVCSGYPAIFFKQLLPDDFDIVHATLLPFLR